MKNFKYIFTFLLLVGVIGLSIAQSPELFKYQAAARSNTGTVLNNQNISVRITIRKNGLSGQIIYQESHTATTNNFGLFSLTIGGGSINQGAFSNIDWGNGIYFMQVELDGNGGTNYTNMGTTQLLSVPYALFAQDVANKDDADASPTNEIQTITKSGNSIILSNGGGTITDDVNDADASPTNEIQTITKSGNSIILSNGGGTITDDVNDADASPTNEIQTITKSGNSIILSNGGGTITDDVNDADASPTNEIQTLSINGNQLTLSNSGGNITLPNIWSTNSNNAYYNQGYVGIGTNLPSSILQLGNGSTHSVLRLTGNGANLSKARLNFGDGEHLYLEENIDNVLSIKGLELIAEMDTVYIGTGIYGQNNQSQSNFPRATLNVKSSINITNPTGATKILNSVWEDEGYIATVGQNNNLNLFMGSLAKNNGMIIVADQLGESKVLIASDSLTNAGNFILSSTGVFSNVNEDKVTLDVDPFSLSGQVTLNGITPSDETTIIDGRIKFNNLAIPSFSKMLLNRDALNFYNNSGGYSISMFNGFLDQVGYFYMYSPLSTNVYLGASGLNSNHGQFELRNSSSITRTLGTILNTGEGYIEVYGPNGNGNISLTTLSSYNDNGFLAIKNSSGSTKAGIYVNSAGSGIVFGDAKNFRMQHPTKADKEIWYGSLEGPELAAYIRGTSKLINGEVVIQFPEHYGIVANPSSMTVILTPLSASSKGLAVVEKTDTGFKVKELANGTGNYEIDWEVKCVRKGYEDYQPVRDKIDALPSIVNKEDINVAKEAENQNKDAPVIKRNRNAPKKWNGMNKE